MRRGLILILKRTIPNFFSYLPRGRWTNRLLRILRTSRTAHKFPVLGVRLVHNRAEPENLATITRALPAGLAAAP